MRQLVYSASQIKEQSDEIHNPKTFDLPNQNDN